ncbi:MAG: hypothetical protein MSA89_02050 [Clostridium sp.]|nr:hypothetical protein [Clostridium sp.]MCI7441859.1 hypothetical protein [Clostridium sp.]
MDIMLIAIVEIIFLKINKGSYNNGLEGRNTLRPAFNFGIKSRRKKYYG